ncbi:hypothetical protein [Hahella ganghwensis]|uniref:hypothetical protein n=1 Tax=Hahella ganghwensis TaxID=286420 RepID=UPI0003820DDE|nr:hypothetical protein [Hahella ganghwensis]
MQRSLDDNILLFQERWLSRSHHERYIESIMQSSVMDTLVSFLEGPPEVLYLEDIDI